jgi:hypothetical protein
MATPEAMAKRSVRQTAKILAAMETMEAEIAGLKAQLAATTEFEAEVIETPSRTDEILLPIKHMSALIEAMTAEIVELKTEIAELKTLVRPTAKPQMPRKSIKK